MTVRRGGEQRVSELVEGALRGLTIHREVRDLLVREAFAAAVGAPLASMCWAVSLERGTLVVATAHSALAQQLQLDSPTVIAAVNTRVGAETVRRLRFVPG